MCGITGIIAFTEKGESYIEKVEKSLLSLSQRGPDGQGIYKNKHLGLGHTRLSIIDTSPAGAQPFTDNTGRYTIILNGEIFNYKEHRKTLIEKGIQFRSQSDTEVLLQLYILEGAKCLEKLNGFFAFAIYDQTDKKLFIARDRYGIKPLLIYRDEDKLLFASEMKALLAYGIPKAIDSVSLQHYLHLNYIPSPHCIFKGVKKLEPGHYIEINSSFEIKQSCYYRIPYPAQNKSIPSYEDAKKELIKLLDQSIQKRLIADVPLGTFLSGGLDSSIITALASQHTKDLNTFSVGYKDEPFFDETRYALLLAKKYKTNHHVFSLSNDDLYDCLHKVLEYIDEPFADSSALAVYILSMNTRKHVKVALSGDGADELFAGYNKHMAEYNARKGGIAANLVKWGSPLWKLLPKSRNSKSGNKIRQLEKFSQGIQLSNKERYWQWAGFIAEDESLLLNKNNLFEIDREGCKKRTDSILESISSNSSTGINDMLYTDMHLVLQGDMLTKVDLMSMSNGLEVRTPFLDYHVVDFAFSLPSSYKIEGNERKKILKDAFRSYLPDELVKRDKQGFEVPLLKWFRSELKTLINDELLADHFIREQGIFNPEAISNLKLKLFSNSPGEVVAQVWGLIVFQYWWKKHMSTH